MKKVSITTAILMINRRALNPPPRKRGESMGAVSLKTQDFVSEAAASDVFEIQSSKLAVRRATEDSFNVAEEA